MSDRLNSEEQPKNEKESGEDLQQSLIRRLSHLHDIKNDLENSMSNSSINDERPESNYEPEDDLRQALMRLTSPQVEELQGELSILEKQIEALRNLEGDAEQLHTLLEKSQSTVKDIDKKLQILSDELRDPEMISQRLEISMIPTLHGKARNQGDDVAEALAPVVGSAIRHQIRNAKDDIINALFPLIGQIIGKAVSESLRELTRNIDARLRQQLSFRDRFNQLFNRLRGVSEGETLIRTSLPFSVEHIFLIHKDTGILLKHLVPEGNEQSEMGEVSGMLTAIQDFVRDSFSDGKGDLEEVAHGDLRILLENGQFAYLAVVLSGIEPKGYNNLINEVIHEVNIQYESELKKFDGNMTALPNFETQLGRLLSPDKIMQYESDVNQQLTRPQRRFIGISLAGFILLLVMIIFACIYAYRLWPIVFASPVPSPMATVTLLIPTMSPSVTPTKAPTNTYTPLPSVTPTISPPSTITPTAVQRIGILSGDLHVRSEPSTGSIAYGVVMAGEEVIVNDQIGDWYFIAWPVVGEPSLSGWIMGARFLELPNSYSQ